MSDPQVPSNYPPGYDAPLPDISPPLNLDNCPACKHPKHVGKVCGATIGYAEQRDGDGNLIPVPARCVCDDVHSRKADTGKVGGFSLLPWSVLRGLACIYDYGRKKYAAHSWQTVPPDKDGRTAEERYEEAMFRHWTSHKEGEFLDPESGKPHIYHFLWGAVAMCWFSDKKTGWKP